MSILEATTGILLIGLRWILEHWSIPQRWTYLLATSIFGLLLLNSLLHLRLTAEPWRITNWMFFGDRLCSFRYLLNKLGPLLPGL